MSYYLRQICFHSSLLFWERIGEKKSKMCESWKEWASSEGIYLLSWTICLIDGLADSWSSTAIYTHEFIDLLLSRINFSSFIRAFFSRLTPSIFWFVRDKVPCAHLLRAEFTHYAMWRSSSHLDGQFEKVEVAWELVWRQWIYLSCIYFSL